MIRNVKTSDAKDITEIYNYYIENTVITFQTDLLSVEETEKKFKEYEEGQIVYKNQKTLTKVVDDNTLQIAQEFRKWLSEQN